MAWTLPDVLLKMGLTPWLELRTGGGGQFRDATRLRDLALRPLVIGAKARVCTRVAAPVIQCQIRACVIQNRRRTFFRWAFCAAFSAALSASADAFAVMSDPSAIRSPDVRILPDAHCHSGPS